MPPGAVLPLLPGYWWRCHSSNAAASRRKKPRLLHRFLREAPIRFQEQAAGGRAAPYFTLRDDRWRLCPRRSFAW